MNMTPTNTQKLLFIRRHCEKSLEMAGKISGAPWVAEPNESEISYTDKDSKLRYVLCESVFDDDASFIAAARTDCPMAMEMVIDAIDAVLHILGCFEAAEIEGLSERLAEQEHETGSLKDLIERRILFARAATVLLEGQIISRFETTHGPITQEQVEALV